MKSNFFDKTAIALSYLRPTRKKLITLSAIGLISSGISTYNIAKKVSRLEEKLTRNVEGIVYEIPQVQSDTRDGWSINEHIYYGAAGAFLSLSSIIAAGIRRHDTSDIISFEEKPHSSIADKDSIKSRDYRNYDSFRIKSK